jgi:uncharacterized protein
MEDLHKNRVTREIVYTRTTKVVLTEDVSPEIFIAGFHGIGHVGWIAVKHIVTKLEARRVGYILTPSMTPFVTIKNGVKVPYELYAADNLLAFMPNVPLSIKDSMVVPQMLAQLVLNCRVNLAVLFGGLDASFAEPDAKPRIAPTSAYLSLFTSSIKRLELPIIDEKLGIAGPLALLLTYLEAGNVPAVAILPYAAVERPDPRAAAQAIEVFTRITNLNIDVCELLAQGVQLEKELAEIEKKIREAVKERESLVYHV